MKKVFFILIFVITQVGYSQLQNKNLSLPTTEEVVYMTNQVTEAPNFIGEKKALDIFIKRNFKQPKVKNGVKGEVLVSFIVEKDGSLSEIGVLSDAGYGTADEAIRVMKLSPNWKAGILNGNNVRVQYMITIPVKPI